MFTDQKLQEMCLTTLIHIRNAHGRNLASEGVSLNPKCLTIGEGKIRYIKTLADEYVLLDNEILRRKQERVSPDKFGRNR